MCKGRERLGSITAAILTGGLGTRLRSVLPDLPKGLALVAGRPFLAHVLDWLDRSGVRRAVLCTGYGAEAIRSTLGQHHGQIQIEHSVEPGPLGTGGALRYALDKLGSDPVLVLNGDSLMRTDLEAFCNWFCSRGAQAGLLMARMADAGRFGLVRSDSVGRVLSFEEKRAHSSGWINAGVYLLRRSVLSRIPVGGACSLETDLFPTLAAERQLWGFMAEGDFIDIGTPESYASADGFFADPGDRV